MNPPTSGHLLCAAKNYAQGVDVDLYLIPREESFSCGDEHHRCPHEFVTRASETSSCRHMRRLHQVSIDGDQDTPHNDTVTGTDGTTVRSDFPDVTEFSVPY